MPDATQLPEQSPDLSPGLRRTLIVCGLILALDVLVVGAPMLGIYAGLALALWLVPRIFFARGRPDLRRHRTRIALVTAAMIAADTATYVTGEAIAERRIVRLADALTSYQAKNHAYPLRLDDLVPAFLPAILPAKPFSIMAGRPTYLYRPDEPGLMYVSIPPFGRRVLNVATREWTDLD